MKEDFCLVSDSLRLKQKRIYEKYHGSLERLWKKTQTRFDFLRKLCFYSSDACAYFQAQQQSPTKQEIQVKAIQDEWSRRCSQV